MSNFTLRPAIRSQVPLFIGIAGGTGSGKTKSAIRLATGIAGRDKPFALIDTEAGRAKHYAPPPGSKPDFVHTFNFHVLELDAPYSSSRYQEAIAACKDYPCIVVDQASFEHIGPGGHLEQQAAELEERVRRALERGDKRPEWKIAEAYNRTSWIKPKHDRKMLIMSMLALRVPVIFCFRAEEKIEIKETKEIGKDGKEYKKTEIIQAKDRPIIDRWVPIVGKEFEPEMLAFFLVTRETLEQRGVPIILKLNEQHAEFVNTTKRLDEETGQRFAQWASGSLSQSTQAAPPSATAAQATEPAITADQAVELEALCSERGIPLDQFKAKAKVERIAQLLAQDFGRAKQWIERHKA